MAGFVAVQPVPVAEDDISSSAFWPTVSIKAAREAMRLTGTGTAERLRFAIINAIASVNSDLADWRQRQQTAGVDTLADVPAEQIDDVSIHVTRYLTAVHSLAEANLRERYRDYDTTADGDKYADKVEKPIDDLRRDARWAIRDILGISRSTVELI